MRYNGGGTRRVPGASLRSGNDSQKWRGGKKVAEEVDGMQERERDARHLAHGRSHQALSARDHRRDGTVVHAGVRAVASVRVVRLRLRLRVMR